MKTNSTMIAARERTERSADLQSAFGGRTRKAGCKPALLCGIAVSCLLAGTAAHAQVNSGSNGSDGAFNPTTNIVINMADHPNGIYQYTSVNISSGVTVTFIPNANNTPVVWLVQSNCVISGDVSLRGQDGAGAQGGLGGPGGHRGGNGGVSATSGQGPGGGIAGLTGGWAGGTHTYGNLFLLPLIGGSGGGGLTNANVAGGGGGGALLIAASGSIHLDHWLNARGGSTASGGPGVAGSGSGGAIRLIASRINGSGFITVEGGYPQLEGSRGRVRFDTYENAFAGNIIGSFSQGFQPIIIPSAGQLPQLTVTSVGGVPVSASPTGALSTPDALLSAQQNNPILIVVQCLNLPLNTQITVSVKPANAPTVSATGLNNTGTLSSSTATVLLNMPRGGGIIYATAATGN